MRTSGRIFVALMVALVVVIGTPGTAAAERSIALLEIEGARTDRLAKSIEKMISKKHKIIDEETYVRAAKRLKAKKINPAHIREVCEYLEADAVIDGTIVAVEGGYRLVLRLHDGVSGERVWRQRLKLRKQALSKSIAPKLQKRILREIAKLGKDKLEDSDDDEADSDDDSDEADDDEAEDEDEDGRETARERQARKRKEARLRKREARKREREEARERAAQRKRKRLENKRRARDKKREAAEAEDSDKDDEEFDDSGDSDDEDEGDELEDDDDEEVASADDEADDEDEDEDEFEKDPLMTGKESGGGESFAADPRERPLVVWAGASVTGRKLRFNHAGLVGNERPLPYKGTPVPGIYLAGELYPMTFSPGPKSALRNVGFGFVFDRVFKLNSAVVDTMGNALADVKTTQQRLGVSVKYRHFLNESASSPMVIVTAGYNQSKFELDKAGAAMGTIIDMPNTSYTYVDPGLGFRMKFGEKLTLSAEARFLLLLDAGEIQEPEQYGAATVTGADGDIAVDYQINNQFSVRVGAHGMTLGYDFKENPNTQQDRNGDGTVDVGGARDTWYGGYLTVGYAY